jgi:heme-degrading monooxygenase HmoA
VRLYQADPFPDRQSLPCAEVPTLVILRIWTAEIDPARAEEYEQFARERSLPMFRSRGGFRGCAFLRRGADCTVVTLWAGPEDVAALEASSVYHETVAAIMAAGFIRTAGAAIAVPVLL